MRDLVDTDIGQAQLLQDAVARAGGLLLPLGWIKLPSVCFLDDPRRLDFHFAERYGRFDYFLLGGRVQASERERHAGKGSCQNSHLFVFYVS